MLEIFIPTYPPDLKQLSLLLRSLDTYLESSAVASLNIAAIGPAESFVHVQEVGTHKFGSRTRYLQPRDLGFGEPNGSREQGWSLQQAAKLAFARQATTEFYMVLDSKNLALRPIQVADLVQDGRAPWVLEDVTIHAISWRGSAWALAHRKFNRTPGRQALSVATPVIFHTASVVAMLDWLERYHGESVERFLMKRRPIRQRFMYPTEFTMYYVFMDREGLLDHYHFASNRLHDVPSQIWSTHQPEIRAERFRRILSRQATGLFTGIQRPVWGALTDEERMGLHVLAAGGRPDCNFLHQTLL
jgi:hypothetical protein